MANREFNQFASQVLQKKVVSLFLTMDYASSGNTITLKKWNYASKALAAAATATGVSPYQTGWDGIKSVARTGTGAFTITLQDKYQRLMHASFCTVATSGVSTLVSMAVDSSTDVTASTPVVKVVFSSATATAADPADGDEITIRLDLLDASEP